MELTKQFMIGMCLGLSLAACAGVTFPYKYYGLDIPGNSLRGPTPADDVALSVCLATNSDLAPCTVMMSDQYLALKQDYLITKQQLIDCQKPPS